MEHCSSIIKTRILLFVTRQMELETIMISDTHQVQKNKYCVITLIERIYKVRVEWWLPEAGGVRRRKGWKKKNEWVLVMISKHERFWCFIAQ